MENNKIQNTNSIQKPISLIIEESKSTIVDAINSARLHPILLEMIVKELYLEIQSQARMMSEREKVEYENMLKESICEEVTE